MAGHDPHRTELGKVPANPGPDRDVASPSNTPDAPTPDRLQRLADLVAEGEVEFPVGLDPTDQGRLIGMVRQRLRTRLIRFIARQIALDIHREAGPAN